MKGSAGLALLIVLVGGSVLLIAGLTGFIGMEQGTQAAGIVSLLAVGIWVGSGVMGHYGGRGSGGGSRALMHIAIWLAIAAGIAGLTVVFGV